MKNEKYLPMGSVVLLKGGTHRLMIVGFCPTNINKENGEIYDYYGVFYPEGMFNTEQIFCFYHRDIEKTFAIGYSDDEEKEFKTNLDATMKLIADDNGKLKVSGEEIIDIINNGGQK